jgi:hypothetical protein
MKYLILIIQITDIVLHVISDQAELLRILANLMIIAWVLKFYKSNRNQFNWTIIGIYLIFNFSFLYLRGLSNDGDPRIFFWAAVLFTSLFSSLIINKKV